MPQDCQKIEFRKRKQKRFSASHRVIHCRYLFSVFSATFSVALQCNHKNAHSCKWNCYVCDRRLLFFSLYTYTCFSEWSDSKALQSVTETPCSIHLGLTNLALLLVETCPVPFFICKSFQTLFLHLYKLPFGNQLEYRLCDECLACNYTFL